MGKFYQIKNKTNTAADLYFYGDIVNDKWGKWTDEDKCPTDIIEMIDECNGINHLNIYVNSGGGSVFAGIAIYNILKRCTANKTVHIDGLAASIASVIALAGDNIIMPKNSFLMIHKAWCMAAGNANELRETADMLEFIEQSIVNVYNENRNEDIEISYIKDLMNAETWLTAEESAKIFKNIEVTESVSAAACITEYRYKDMPKDIIQNKADTAKKTHTKNTSIENIKDITKKLKRLNNFIFLEEEESV